MEQKKTINKKLIAIIAGISTVVCIVVAVSVLVIGEIISDYSPVSFVPDLVY